MNKKNTPIKIEAFKQHLRSSLERICSDKGWKYDNPNQRGHAFEDWCFFLFCDRYQSTENILEDCVIRGDDSEIDIVFESGETEEVYILQCKHPKPIQTEPIPESEVKVFFSNYHLLKDDTFFAQRNTRNQKIKDLLTGFSVWEKQNYQIHFIFISTGEKTEKTSALVNKFNKDNQSSNVKFEVWDITALKEEFISIQNIEEKYPEQVKLTLAENHFLLPTGSLDNITFALPATVLSETYFKYKDSLFNWNIRRFLGKKGQVNSGLVDTLNKEPEHFYYYNNGISALCESFEFDETNRSLCINKMQIVNGAQTVGAIRSADKEKLAKALVLVKLTAIRHAQKETSIAASLIRTNNTQNTLRVPDFRVNDKIQLWIEQKFKDTKNRGDSKKIIYGRKRPYPKSSINQTVLKLQDLGKIRYAWFHDPRIPIAEPARLFQMPEDGGLYGDAFGIDGELVDVWSDEQFDETLFAIYTYKKISEELESAQENDPELKQLNRLRYYGLNLFKIYLDQSLQKAGTPTFEDLLAFGGKYDVFYKKASAVIIQTLKSSYLRILKQNEGTAFSLPRDPKIWDMIKDKFNENLELIKGYVG